MSTQHSSARAPAQIVTGVAPPHSLEAEQSVLGGSCSQTARCTGW
jgi:hypothetical protein